MTSTAADLRNLLLSDVVSFWNSVTECGLSDDHRAALDSIEDTPDTVDQFDMHLQGF